MSVAPRLADPGYTPGKKELAEVVELADDPEHGPSAIRAAARAGLPAGLRAIERLTPGRVSIAGRVAREHPDPRLYQALTAALAEGDPRTRKAAIVAMGKIRAPEIEAALIARHAVASEIDKRAIAVSLGKVGGERSRALTTGRAKIMLERTLARAPASVALEVPLPRAMTIVWRCRRGLEELLREDVGGEASAGEVKRRAALSLADALKTRVALDVCLEWKLEKKPAWEALAHPVLLEAMRAWTRGPLRFRAELAGTGHRRAALWELAEKLASLTSEIVSDPTEAPWDVIVERERLLLRPKAFEDPRFTYRVKDVPAASHPTLAAALARVAGAREDDVVWDPFVGSGLELAERARLGPYARLVGTDVSEEAITAARANLTGLGAELALADARDHRVTGVTLVLSNPPMGRRLARDRTVASLYARLLENVKINLVRGGRMVWLSARPGETAERARSLGFLVTRRGDVDVGGFGAEIQIFRREG